MHLLGWKWWNSDSNFTEICSQGSIWQAITGSENGLAPNKRQAIIWTSNGLVDWCIYALASIDVLINSSPPSAAYMRQWTGSAFIHVMAWHMFGAKPLPVPKLTYSQLDL